MKGRIFNIKKYSIHDGPGIRTTVFLKGCPLSCLWCHNPEGIEYENSFFYDSDKCLDCIRCIESCASGCIQKTQSGILIDSKTCNHCNACVMACPTNALTDNGKFFTVEELLKTLKKDEIFYDESGGGVTFSGGEPLFQIDFLEHILKRCNSEGLHTVVDTSGFCSTENFERIKDFVDLFLYDIKFIDPFKHKQYTGVSNEVIKLNFRTLISNDNRVWVRIPLIPGINDSQENIMATVAFLKDAGFSGRVHLLAYHGMSDAKVRKMINSDDKTKVWPSKFDQINKERMNKIFEIFKSEGFDSRIGG